MRMGAPAGLHIGYIDRILDVINVKNADSAQPIMAHCLLHAFSSAIQPSAKPFAGDKHKISIH